MKRRNPVPETLIGISLLLLILPCFLGSCSKASEDIEGRTIQVDLTDTTFHHLLHKGGSVNIEGIIVVNMDAGYIAATEVCTVCMNRSIVYDIFKSWWNCYQCGGFWDIVGIPCPGCYDRSGPRLKVYNVTKSGNILTIHI